MYRKVAGFLLRSFFVIQTNLHVNYSVCKILKHQHFQYLIAVLNHHLLFYNSYFIMLFLSDVGTPHKSRLDSEITV